MFRGPDAACSGISLSRVKTVCVPDWESIFQPFVDQTLNTMIQNYVTQFLFNFNETSSKKDE